MQECDAAAVQNVVLISIASVMDPSLAPAGKHSLHAYLPATEPFHLWEGGAPFSRLPTHHHAGYLILALILTCSLPACQLSYYCELKLLQLKHCRR